MAKAIYYIILLYSMCFNGGDSRYSSFLAHHLAVLKTVKINEKKAINVDKLIEKEQKDKTEGIQNTKIPDEVKPSTEFTSEAKIQLAITLLSVVAPSLIYRMKTNNPSMINVARIVFVCYIIMSQLLFWYLKKIVNDASDKSIIPSNPNPFQQMKGLASFMRPQPAQTAQEYDLSEIDKFSSNLFFEVCYVTFSHLYQKNMPPLLAIPFVGILNKLRSPLIRIHIFKEKPNSELTRPFKGPFASLFESMQQPTISVTNDTNDVEDDLKPLSSLTEDDDPIKSYFPRNVSKS